MKENTYKFERLKNLLEHLVEENYAPGHTMMVYVGENRVFHYSCGYSDLDKKISMTGEEYLYLYSCSKVVTVTAALQLLEQGRFLLTDPLYDYIPEYKDMYIALQNGELMKAKKHITIQQLFNMTAGLSYNLDTAAIKKAKELTNGKMNTELVVRCLAQDPLLFEPGERFEYSLCHDVLAGVVSIITGKKFRDYVKENIFEPLNMKNSTYHLTPQIQEHMAVQYRFEEKDGKRQFVDAGPGNIYVLGEAYDSGGAGLISTVPDYMKFAQALANQGIGLTGERILSPYTIDLMRRNTLEEKQLPQFSLGTERGYGYGLGVRTMMDGVRSGTIGNTGEFGWWGAAGSTVYIDPDRKLAAFYGIHSLNPKAEYYQPRIRNTMYACLD